MKIFGNHLPRLSITCLFWAHGFLAYKASGNPLSAWMFWVVDYSPFHDFQSAGIFLKIVASLDLLTGTAIWIPHLRKPFLYWALFWTVLTAGLRLIVYWDFTPLQLIRPWGEFFARIINWSVVLVAMANFRLLRGRMNQLAFSALKIGLVFWFLSRGSLRILESFNDPIIKDLHFLGLPSFFNLILVFLCFANAGWLTYLIQTTQRQNPKPLSWFFSWVILLLILFPSMNMWMSNHQFFVELLEHLPVFFVFEIVKNQQMQLDPHHNSSSGAFFRDQAKI